MKIWTIMNGKGGTGKSTLSMNMSVEAARQGHEVLLLDLDKHQPNSFNWGVRRDDKAPDVYKVKDVEQLKNYVQKAKDKGFTQVIIDTKGAQEVIHKESAKLSTLCVIPCPPTTVDTESSVDTVTMLKQIVDNRFSYVMMRCPSSGKEIEDTKANLKNLGFVCPHVTINRKPYNFAYTNDLAVCEYADILSKADERKRAEKAVNEIKKIYQWLIKLDERLNNEF